MSKHFLSLVIILTVFACTPKEDKPSLEQALDKCSEQLLYQLYEVDHLTTDKLIAPRTVEDGQIKMVQAWDWTSGFYAGTLWMMYDYTKDEFWRSKANRYTQSLKTEQWNTGTHDLGFKMFGSFGKGFQLTKDPEYKKVLIQSAKTLASRFNPIVGCIRSWDHGVDKWYFPVIIDNMMNLELLFWAAKQTGNDTMYNIAVTHAMTTLKNHFREDYSTWHVIDYNPESGEVRKRNTAQGYADGSTWARGQAWALYGYIMVYRETGIPVFLGQAEKVAEFILDHPKLPEDMIPYWDYDTPDTSAQPRDASAAAITASALLELSQYSKSKDTYLKSAKIMLLNLYGEKYFAKVATNKGFLLKHSTGSIPHNSEIDVPLNYADYYFVEALLRLRELSKA